jgi:hypothetical protein
MRMNTNITPWLALAVAALVAATAVADDRNFLRQLNAPPNLIFVLDTSGSMIGTPEEPYGAARAAFPYAMVPGGGDDPYSRMGIAKRVLKDFLEDVDANYVLAGYAQGRPPDPELPVPRKHWVYQTIGVDDSGTYRSDHFHLAEKDWAYRIGWTESFSGIILDNPASILKSRMIGYDPYFDPNDLATYPVEDRYGPESARDVDSARPFDLLPMYLGFTCFMDDMGTPGDDSDDVQRCADRVFPFYDTGMNWPDGSAVVEMWDYGLDGDPAIFDNCEPWRTPTALDPDDGCKTTWFDNTGTIPGFIGRKVEFQRRVHLEIPNFNPYDSSQPNHPLGITDPDGVAMSGDEVPSGNQQVADMGMEDYDLDSSYDPDYDDDATYDWVLYVDAVEQIKARDAGPVETPTFTPTHTPTDTPTRTPTPTPFLDCGLFNVVDDLDRMTYDKSRINMEVRNLTGYDAYLVSTYIDWGDTESRSYNPRINYLRFDGECDDTYWRDDFTNSPAIAPRAGDSVPPIYRPNGNGDCYDNEMVIRSWDTGDQDWDAYLYGGESWVGQTCVQLDFYFPFFNQYCSAGDCTTNYSLNTPTPTPTFTPSPTPTITPTPYPTRTPTYTPTGPTPTPTPSRTPTPTVPYYTPTNTPTASSNTPTYTPTSPPAATNTPTRTNTPYYTPTNTPDIDA